MIDVDTNRVNERSLARALSGKQARQHTDVDWVFTLSDAQAVIAAPASHGFGMQDDELPTRSVLKDALVRRVDLHPVTPHAEGGGRQYLQDRTHWRYPPYCVLSVGRFAGRPMPSIPAEVQALADIGYEPKAKAPRDMHPLAEEYVIELSTPYQACGGC